ncbi:MAG TPA: 30S ribosomal protein S6 [Polyangiaceae bacterium]
MEATEVPKVREYETIYVLSPTTAKEASDKVASRVTEVLGREGGTLTLVENWGRRQLAYPVAKHRRGVYVYLKYTGGGAAVAELERNFRMLDEVLKFQTVKVRDDVDPASLKVDEAVIKFESLDPPEEEEMEETLEQQLGLAEPLPGAASSAAASASAAAAAAASGDDSKSDDDSEAAEGSSDEEEEA